MSFDKLDVIGSGEFADQDTKTSAASVLRSKRGLSASLPEVLASVGIGLAIIVGVGVGIGAAVNFGNDSSAQSALQAVKSAQLLHQGKTGTFGTLEQLTKGDPAALTDAGNVKIASTATNYCATVKSTSMAGTQYWITAKSSKILTAKPDAALLGDATCPA